MKVYKSIQGLFWTSFSHHRILKMPKNEFWGFFLEFWVFFLCFTDFLEFKVLLWFRCYHRKTLSTGTNSLPLSLRKWVGLSLNISWETSSSYSINDTLRIFSLFAHYLHGKSHGSVWMRMKAHKKHMELMKCMKSLWNAYKKRIKAFLEF